MVDQRVEEALRLSHAHTKTRQLVPLPKSYPEQRISTSDLFVSVEKSCSEAELFNPYFLICKYLILDDMGELLTHVKNWLNSGISAHLLRGVTHLVLVLRKLCVIVETDHIDIVNEVIHACVKVSFFDYQSMMFLIGKYLSIICFKDNIKI